MGLIILNSPYVNNVTNAVRKVGVNYLWMISVSDSTLLSCGWHNGNQGSASRKWW